MSEATLPLASPCGTRRTALGLASREAYEPNLDGELADSDGAASRYDLSIFSLNSLSSLAFSALN